MTCSDPVFLRADRLDAMARALADSGAGLALLALGSAAETSRLDRWSDLDFFAIVRPGSKQRFLDGVDWLAAAHPLAWAYRNTADGWKALFADGIFVECAVFEPQELERIPFAPGRIIWHADGFEAGLCTPSDQHFPRPSDTSWLVGEALSNLFIGLGRWRRGERLAGFKLVQSAALDAVLKLTEQTFPVDGGDRFAPERRFEHRHPDLSTQVPRWTPGVDHTPEAALAILGFLEAHFPVPQAIARAIRELVG